MIKPLNDNVVLEKNIVSNKTNSGIILSNKDEEFEYVVQAIADSVKDLKVGDKVYFNEYESKQIKLDNKEYIIVNIKDILAKVE